eukprot:CAMPEP_0172759982 /NCGR_PEP_ID=MMETSP1074-20121228/168779_1 /TAXON_ID=2916 /ORGANISM="Ceratium fusus, Strain PA161109" /LENGTH=111 /DNA_ID=CAMNT_0013593885 /DNA_START=61 /DNA_END=396 /DNA_ORIENTATION=+
MIIIFLLCHEAEINEDSQRHDEGFHIGAGKLGKIDMVVVNVLARTSPLAPTEWDFLHNFSKIVAVAVLEIPSDARARAARAWKIDANLARMRRRGDQGVTIRRMRREFRAA